MTKRNGEWTDKENAMQSRLEERFARRDELEQKKESRRRRMTGNLTQYRSADGDTIDVEDYIRWIEQAREAYHCLDENFNEGAGAEGEDRESQLADLLCQLMHMAELDGIPFALALAHGQHNYAAEKPRSTRMLNRLRKECAP